MSSSKSEVLKHVSLKELSVTPDGDYFCSVCEVKLGQQPMPHINGSSHKNKLFNKVIRDKQKYSSLYNKLDSRVRSAIANGSVRIASEGILCTVCNLNFSGEKPLQDHLSSTSHEKKDERQKIARLATQQSPQNTSDSSSSDDLIKRNMTKGIIVGKGTTICPNIFKCQACDKEMTGIAPTIQHLESEKHKKNVPKLQLGFFDSSAVAQALTVNIPTDRSHFLGNFDEIEEALKRGILVGSGTISGQYTCQRCNKSMSGAVPTQQHLNSDKHLKKITEYRKIDASSTFTSCDSRKVEEQSTSKIPSNLPSPTCTPETAEPSTPMKLTFTIEMPTGSKVHVPPSNNEEQNAVISSMQQLNLSETFPGTSKSGNNCSSAGVKNLSTGSSRGLVLVFNYIFHNRSDFRIGAQVDSENIDKLFRELNYRVSIYEDLRKKETLEILKMTTQLNLKDTKSLIMFFLSHGVDQNSFGTSDNEVISVEEIWSLLTDSKCPDMKDKPKIMMMNYCRGKSVQANLYYDSPTEELKEAPNMVAIVQAALSGIKAARTSKGTIFVQSLCEVIRQYAKTHTLTEIIKKTSEIMKKNNGTTATVELIDMDNFYFA